MRKCVASTCPDSNLKRMYLPRLPTDSISELRNCRANAGREIPGAIRLRLSSAARMRRPLTSGDRARTTCSTSGSSGICLLDYVFDLVLSLLDQTVFTRLDVQAQKRFSV